MQMKDACQGTEGALGELCTQSEHPPRGRHGQTPPQDPSPDHRTPDAARRRRDPASAVGPPGVGQESVWDYPRPPAVEETDAVVEVWFNDVCVARSRRAVRVLETSHPPVYYVPLDDCVQDVLEAVLTKRTQCEYKGRASYYNLRVGDRFSEEAAWRYARPRGHYGDLSDRVAFYPSRVDRCVVDGETVEAQASGYYGGWVTRSLIGPFKGPPGSEGW